jgi:hypothetical protein
MSEKQTFKASLGKGDKHEATGFIFRFVKK